MSDVEDGDGGPPGGPQQDDDVINGGGDDVDDSESEDDDDIPAPPDEYVVDDTSLEGALLAKVLSQGNRNNIGRNQYWKYGATVRTTMKINGCRETSTKGIEYNIEPRDRGAGEIARYADDTVSLEAGFSVSDGIQSDIDYASKRVPALPASFPYMDMAAIVERLAAGIAYFSIGGVLSPVILRGGGAVNVRSIKAASGNIAVGPRTVFLSARDADRRSPGTMCALINAISGEGGIAYTDLLQLDGNGAAQVPHCEGLTLVHGCYEALLELGWIYKVSGAGPTFSLAVMRGINNQLSLASHSDEGGYIRSVLRCGRFATPSGAIIFSPRSDPYTGLPTPQPSLGGFRHLAHSILVGGAGLVAASDPMVEIGGKMYPTSFTMPGVDTDGAGDAPAVAPTDRQTIRMQQRWLDECGRFSPIYTANLAILFGMDGDVRTACDLLNTMAAIRVDRGVERHMRFWTVVPFVWVEPTSCVPWMGARGPATRQKCGPLCTATSEQEMPAIAGYRVVSDETAELLVDIDVRYPRRHGVFVHLTEHARDGMANFRMVQASPENFANVGGAGDMGTRILNADGYDTYAWGRLHNRLIAIGEMIDLNNATRFILETETNEARIYDRDLTHAPKEDELSQCVIVRCSIPRPMGVGHLGAAVVNVVRSRNRAAKALTYASVRSTVRGAEFEFAANAQPMLVDPGIHGGVDSSNIWLNGSRFESDDRGASRRETSNEASATTGEVEVRMGQLVPIIINNEADRGRRAGRGPPGGGRGPGGGGGGGRGGGGPPGGGGGAGGGPGPPGGPGGRGRGPDGPPPPPRPGEGGAGSAPAGGSAAPRPGSVGI